MDAVAWITQQGGRVIDRNNGFVHFPCGVCGEAAGRSAFLVLESGFVSCFQPSCFLHGKGRAIHINAYRRMVEGADATGTLTLPEYVRKAWEDKAGGPASIPLPEEFIPINAGNGMLADQARDYIVRRGLDPGTLWKDWGVGYAKTGPWGGRILIPFLGRSGNCTYFQGRDFTGTQDRWRNPPDTSKEDYLYNLPAVGGTGDLLEFEGAFNCLTMGKGTPSVSTLGSSMSDTQALLLSRHRGRVIIVPDGGAWVAALEKARALCHWAETWIAPLAQGDASSIGREATLEVVGRAVPARDDQEINALLRATVRAGGKTYPPSSPSPARKVTLW